MADKDAAYFTEQAEASMAKHVAAMVGFMDKGAEVFDYGNSIRDEARKAGYDRAFDFPGLRARLHPTAVRGGSRPVPVGRAVRRPEGHRGHRSRCAGTVSRTTSTCAAGSRWPRRRSSYQGLPARICWLGYGERHKAGLRFNEMVANGEVSAPIVIGRDHLDSGSVASPYRETEAMADGSDAIADWPLLNALVNTASGASWVSIHHGGGVGMGRSIHAGQVTVADGTALAAEKLERVLTNDPGMGVIRHVDAGYEHATNGGRRTRGAHPHAGTVVSFDHLWGSILDVGRDAVSGGYRRFAWTTADLTLREWFTGEAQQRGMTVEEDRNGNLWAWWLPAGVTGDPRGAFVTGSHLDSVPDGGAFDGPLGIVSAFAAIDLLRADDVEPRVPVAVVAFSDEEGARFGVACVGSQLSTGALTPGTRAGPARRRRHHPGRRADESGPQSRPRRRRPESG